MRVAVIKNSGNINTKIERVLLNNKINGDFIDKFTRNSLNVYDTVIFTYKNDIPNLPKVIEQIVLEKKCNVIFISNNLSVGQYYNILNDLYFNIVNEQMLDIELPIVIKNSKKYLDEINKLSIEVNTLKERLDTLNLINKAKRILLDKGFNEAESHQFIQKQSMDLRLSKKMTAQRIIENKIDF